jgi:hypothetical protein
MSSENPRVLNIFWLPSCKVTKSVSKQTKFIQCFSSTVLSIGFIGRAEIELQVPGNHIFITASTFIIWFVVKQCCCFSIGFHTNEGTVYLRRSNLWLGVGLQLIALLKTERSPHLTPLSNTSKLATYEFSNIILHLTGSWNAGLSSVNILRRIILTWDLRSSGLLRGVDL